MGGSAYLAAGRKGTGCHIPCYLVAEAGEAVAPQLASCQYASWAYSAGHSTHVVSCDPRAGEVSSEGRGDHPVHRAVAHRINNQGHTGVPRADHVDGGISVRVVVVHKIEERHSLHSTHNRRRSLRHRIDSCSRIRKHGHNSHPAEGHSPYRGEDDDRWVVSEGEDMPCRATITSQDRLGMRIVVSKVLFKVAQEIPVS